jgi:RNA polymerase sigma-70 factor (ECF subfamily)
MSLDSVEFDAFYAASHARLLRHVAVIIGDRAEAEDVLQEAWARAAQRWRMVRALDAPEAWVRRVALNLAADLGRRARRGLAAMARHGPPPDLPELSADSVDLLRAMRTLPARQREALVLRHVQGLGVAEIAVQMQVPDGTVKTWLARGRRALADRLVLEIQVEVRADG